MEFEPSSSKGLGDLLLERQLEALEREQRALMRENGLLFYRPHERQDWFHSADFKFRYGRTGNRFGKSAMGSAEGAAFARGERSWYKYPFDVINKKFEVVRKHEGGENHPLVHQGLWKRPTKGLIICADWDKADEIFTSSELDEFGVPRGKLVSLLPKGKWDTESSNGNIVKVIVESVHGGESSIYLDTVKSFKGNSLGQESSDWDWIHVDEPCPKEMWIANARGLIDRGGKAWFTCTPLTELWINDMFLPREHARQSLAAPITKDNSRGRTLYWTMTGSSFDNPFTKEDDINDIFGEEVLSEDQREARTEGIPSALTGTIYKEFQPAKHVYSEIPKGWTDYNVPPMDATISIAIDTHPVNPTAVLFRARLVTGEKFFFEEIYAKLGMKELIEIIADRLGGHTLSQCLVEPAAWIQSPDGDCLAFDLIDAAMRINLHLPIEKAPKDLARGIFRVKKGLLETTVHGKPVMRFSPHLRETLWEFDRYTWDVTRGREGKPVDRDDHMMECLYRLETSDMMYIEPEVAGPMRPEKRTPMALDLSIPKYVGFDNAPRPTTRNRYVGERHSTKEEVRQHNSDIYYV